jgi:hypothetical protein
MLIHGTGSGVPYVVRIAQGWNLDIEFQATINWFESPSNRAKDANGNLLNYGACSNYVIGAEGQRAVAWPDDYRPTWSAGWGMIFGWALDHYAISYEVCQPGPDWPLTEEQYERLGYELARLHKAYGVALVTLPYLTQLENPVPSGVTRHDNCANGRAYGKTDPGPLFDDARVIAEAKRWQALRPDLFGEEDDMSLTEAQVKALIEQRVKPLEERLNWTQGFCRTLRNLVAPMAKWPLSDKEKANPDREADEQELWKGPEGEVEQREGWIPED